MEDGDAEATVRVDVGVVERANELEIYSGLISRWEGMTSVEARCTRWAVGVVFGKGQLGLEVAAVVERVGIHDDEGDAPLEDIVVDQLQRGQQGVHARAGLQGGSPRCWSTAPCSGSCTRSSVSVPPC